MKWYASSSSEAKRVVSSTKGEERAKELWTVRMSSEFDRTSPRSWFSGQPICQDYGPIESALTSEGNAAVNSLNSVNWGPIVILSSWFRSTDNSACVPHAFWIVCAAKKRDSDAAGS
jgi:hypothetical protein